MATQHCQGERSDKFADDRDSGYRAIICDIGSAAQKVSGAIHHSSLTGGHCCRFAGSITVEGGRVRKVTPHSGHYVPTQAEYDALIDSWRGAGLDLSEAELGGLVKQGR